jgi:AcrR family transcriptional regulator
MSKKIKTKTIERKQEILDAAIYILAIDGYPKFTMRNVAKRVGVRLGTVQYYFSNKRELLQSAIFYTANRWNRKMDEIVTRPNMKDESRLKQVLKIHFASCIEPLTSGFFVALWALAAHDEDALELLNEVYGNACERFSKLASRLNPELDDDEALNKGIMIIAMLEGMVLILGPGKKYESRHTIMEENMVEDILKFVLDT